MYDYYGTVIRRDRLRELDIDDDLTVTPESDAIEPFTLNLLSVTLTH